MRLTLNANLQNIYALVRDSGEAALGLHTEQPYPELHTHGFILTLLTRERIRHVQSEKRRWRWLLPPSVQEEACRTHDAQQPKIQTEKGLQQQPYSKPHGQETGHTHAACDRGAVLPLLDTYLCR